MIGLKVCILLETFNKSCKISTVFLLLVKLEIILNTCHISIYLHFFLLSTYRQNKWSTSLHFYYSWPNTAIIQKLPITLNYYDVIDNYTFFEWSPHIMYCFLFRRMLHIPILLLISETNTILHSKEIHKTVYNSFPLWPFSLYFLFLHYIYQWK